MIIEFLEDAEQVLFEAALWYESKEAGLGIRFRDEIAYVLERIAEDPLLWRERLGGYRSVAFGFCKWFLCGFWVRLLCFWVRLDILTFKAFRISKCQAWYPHSRILTRIPRDPHSSCGL